MPLDRFASFSLFTPSALASRRALFSGCLAGLAAACSINSGEMPKANGAASSGADGGVSIDAAREVDAGTDAGTNVITEKGVMLDYETLSPVPGLTVTDNGVSATTDSTGAFSLSVPSSVTSIAATVSGPGYSTLLFPTVAPADGGIDFGTNVMGDTNTFGLEQSVLQNDQTTAIVQIVAQVTGACASAAGGTLQVLSPAGASVEYFSTLNLPNPSLTSFAAVTAPRPVAVVYNIAPGAVLTVAVTHPTCALVPFPTMAVSGVQELTGEVRTAATEPGDVNAALVLVLQ